MTSILGLGDEKFWNFLRWNSYLSVRHKILYVATPKVACTTLKWWFASLEGVADDLHNTIDSNETNPDLIIHDSFYKLAPHITGLPPEALLDALTSDSYFRFAVVRNPYRRIFSAWQSKLLLREPLQSGPYLEYEFFQQPIESAKDIAIGFEGFLEHLESHEAPDYRDVHWTPQATLLRPDLITYSMLAKIEDIKDLRGGLKKRLGAKFVDPFSGPRTNESLIPYCSKFITDRAAQLIRSLYAEDFETFGYSTRSPVTDVIFSAAQLGVALHAVGLIRGRHQRIREMRLSFSGQIASLGQTVAECGGQIASLGQTVAEREGQITSLGQTVAEREGQITSLGQTIAEREGQITSLGQTVVERDGQITSLGQTIAEREGQITSLGQALAERDRQIADADQALAVISGVLSERELHSAKLNQAVDERDRQLQQIISSRSWRVTRPMRFVGRLIRSEWPTVMAGLRPYSQNWARLLYRLVPLPAAWKSRIAHRVFHISSSFLDARVLAELIGKSKEAGNSGNVKAATLDVAKSEYVPLLKDKPLVQKPAKLICFYLPQYHPIPENDVWWGKGFTEWTNVQPAQPQFSGHYQPRVPGELGYYDLLDKNVQRRQIELSKLYGIEGFCFYFYWFNGKRVLDAPLENYLNDPSLDLPFCLCWANENWTRRWDGLEKEILISQRHSAADDLAFIKHVARFMRDPRYIRVSGKPLLLVYRPDILPSAKETAVRWRKWCREYGIGEICLAYTQSFARKPPVEYGFDAAIEFPPNLSSPSRITESVTPLEKDFSCTVYDWRDLVRRCENYTDPGYRIYRTVCPDWDNTARRKNRSTVFLNNSPGLYQYWLENAVRDTRERYANPDDRLIFVNAWNEWAEGAYLEPDARRGYAYLQATRNALAGTGQSAPTEQRKIIVVTHDAYYHGAQLLALNLIRTLNSELGFQVDLVCLGDGPLKVEYAKWAKVHDLAGRTANGVEAVVLANMLYSAGHRVALVNSTISGHFLQTLTAEGIECVALIHELRSYLERHLDEARAIATHAKRIVFPAPEVAKQFRELVATDDRKVVIRPQGLFDWRQGISDRSESRRNLRRLFNLDPDALVVFGLGFGDRRKGVDLFVEAGLKAMRSNSNTHWIWVGHWDSPTEQAVIDRLKSVPQLKDRFIFPGLQRDTAIFYEGADVFALPSREDPFPLALLQALDAGLPVVAFEGAGGFGELLKEVGGKLVKMENEQAFAEAVTDLLADEDRRLRIGRRGSEVIAERFSFRHYIYDLLDYAGIGLDRITVIVPNFNYERYLPERLSSIFQQDYPIYEIIFLDDCSTDNSIQVARDVIAKQPIDFHIIRNEKNSGSPFRQWKKGVDLAKGNLIWIAEADDTCDNDFIDEVRKGFRTPTVVLSYCESRQIDGDGRLLANDYLHYVSDIDRTHWLNPFVMDGEKEAVRSFCIKNVIPNVSAVLFDAERLRSVLDANIDRIQKFRVAGDWFVYALLLKQGRIAFFPKAANVHRRHASSVTLGSFNEMQIKEIVELQTFIAKEFCVPHEQTARARAYADRVAAQLNVINESAAGAAR